MHLHTLKGKGVAQAEANKEAFHWILPGTLDNKTAAPAAPTYDSVTVDYMLQKRAKDPAFIVLNPATPGACGLTPQVREKLGKGFADGHRRRTRRGGGFRPGQRRGPNPCWPF